LALSLTPIISELFFVSFDSATKNQKKQILYFINYLIFTILILTSLFVVYEKTVLILSFYILVEQLFLIGTKTRPKLNNNLFLLFKVISIFIIYFYHVGFLLLLIIFYMIILDHGPFFKKLDFSIIKKTILASFPVCIATRARDFLQNLVFTAILNNDSFFVFNLLQKIFQQAALVHYLFFRNIKYSIKYFKIIFKSIHFYSIIILIAILLGYILNFSFILYLEIFALLSALFVEGLLSQIILIKSTYPIQKLISLNLLAILLFGILYYFRDSLGLLSIPIATFSIMLFTNYFIYKLNFRS
jgi:hypothetical protein